MSVLSLFVLRRGHTDQESGQPGTGNRCQQAAGPGRLPSEGPPAKAWEGGKIRKPNLNPGQVLCHQIGLLFRLEGEGRPGTANGPGPTPFDPPRRSGSRASDRPRTPDTLVFLTSPKSIPS